jgi:hypothetical protein
MHYIAVVAAALVAAAAGAAAPPDIPLQWTAHAEIQGSFMPKQQGFYYYDAVGNRQRIDETFFGVTGFTIDLFDFNKTYQIVPTSGGKYQCTASDTSFSLFPAEISPYAVNKGEVDVDGDETTLWEADYIGANTYYYVIMGDDATKTPNHLRKVDNNAFGFKFNMSFTNVSVVELDDSVFDVEAYGCPPPVPPVTYPVAGYVLDATNGAGVTGATVKMTGHASGNTYSGTTSDQGYSFSAVAPDLYTLQASASGYITATAELNVSRAFPIGTGGNIFVSPSLPAGEMRAVLSWGSIPRDLDAHAYLAGCEVYYASRTCTAGSSTVTLDHDVTTGFGPETVTFTNVGSGTGSATYGVYMYSYMTGGLEASDAHVKLYSTSGLVKEYTITAPPGPTCRLWNVFSLDLASGAVSEVNTFTNC